MSFQCRRWALAAVLAVSFCLIPLSPWDMGDGECSGQVVYYPTAVPYRTVVATPRRVRMSPQVSYATYRETQNFGLSDVTTIIDWIDKIRGGTSTTSSDDVKELTEKMKNVEEGMEELSDSIDDLAERIDEKIKGLEEDIDDLKEQRERSFARAGERKCKAEELVEEIKDVTSVIADLEPEFNKISDELAEIDEDDLDDKPITKARFERLTREKAALEEKLDRKRLIKRSLIAQLEDLYEDE